MRNSTGSRARFAKLASRSALATMALSMGATAFAQDAEPNRVIVTGSYIPQAESEGPLPVSVYTTETLTKVGATTAAEGLRGQIPSYVGATATENDSNGGTGAANINLRALGAGNTLTLINGRRAFATPNSGGYDINLIGLGMISRTEVLKDGASAIYGSDAVAGVVNFVLLNGPGAQPFKGLEVDFLYGNTTEKDAHVFQAYVNAGWANEKFSVVLSANWYQRQDIYSRDRDLSRFANTIARGGNANTLSASEPGVISLRALTVNGVTYPTQQRIIANDTQLIAPGLASTRPYVVGQDGFDFRAYTPAIPGQERWSYYGAFQYKPFADGRLVVYGDALVSENRQNNGLAPAPVSTQLGTGFLPRGLIVGGTAAAPINVAPVETSPFNPFGRALNNVRYRFVDELNNRRSGFDTRDNRFTFGIRGDIPVKGNNFISAFNYDFGVLYDESKQVRTDNGDANYSLILAQYLPNNATTRNVVLPTVASGALLLQAQDLNSRFGGTFNPFLGVNAPRVGTAPIYGSVNGVPTGVQIGTAAYDNRAAAARAQYTANAIDQTQNTLYDARIGATLFPNLPQGGISFTLGAEYRKERSKHDGDINQVTDPNTGYPNVLGFNPDSNTSFRRNVYSVYGEVAIPIITPTMKVPFVYAFDIQAAVRFEQFNTYGQDPTIVDPNTGVSIGPVIKRSFDNGATPRLTIRWQPFDQLTVRGSYGRSFSSPGVGSLFTPATSFGFPQIFDSLTGTLRQTDSGVNGVGNPDLQPEKTNTYTAGFVFTPKMVKGLTMTVDYYQLNSSALIIGPTAQAQVLASLNAASGGTLFAITEAQALAGVAGVYRNTANLAANGQALIDTINGTFANTGKRYVQGLDIVVSYDLPFDRFGKFSFTLGLNHFFTYKADVGAGIGNTNFLGKNLTSLPLAPGAVPYNKGFFRAEWQWRGFDFVANLNYVGDYLDAAGAIQANGALPNGGIVNTPPQSLTNPVYFYNRKTREYLTLDLQASYEFKRPVAATGYSKDSKGARTQVAADNSGTFFQRLLWGTRLRAGVNNVADTPPPFDPGGLNDNYDTNTYSIRNRFYYVGINKKF